MEGGRKKFPPFKIEAQKVLPCLEGGGGAKSFGPAIFPFCSPPIPIINDQSLKRNGRINMGQCMFSLFYVYGNSYSSCKYFNSHSLALGR